MDPLKGFKFDREQDTCSSNLLYNAQVDEQERERGRESRQVSISRSPNVFYDQLVLAGRCFPAIRPLCKGLHVRVNGQQETSLCKVVTTLL